MKKSLIFVSLLLVACGGTTNIDNGLIRLNTEPTNCEYLYTMDSSSSTYNISDAYDYLEKSILEQNANANTYYIDKETALENVGAIFGPKQTYKFKAKVYNCK
jgi:hypothetical protein